MRVLEAHNIVCTLLASQLVEAAQEAVIRIESACSVLPSSTFERVLMSAVQASKLSPEYMDFIQRAYGKERAAIMISTAVNMRIAELASRAESAMSQEMRCQQLADYRWCMEILSSVV